MSSYKTQQYHLVRRGRSFHFVSYEGHPADPKRQQPELPPSWYMMLAGKRWMVMPEVGETTPEELDRQFGEWLDARVFDGTPAVQSQQPPSKRRDPKLPPGSWSSSSASPVEVGAPST